MKKLIFSLGIVILGSIIISNIFLVKESSSDVIINQINKIRKVSKLKQLSENYILNKTATNKACDMKINNYWSHKNLKGQMSWEMIVNSGYKYMVVGENLARNLSDDIVVSKWMASPTHRAIIMTANYREIGIGRCGHITVIHLGNRKR